MSGQLSEFRATLARAAGHFADSRGGFEKIFSIAHNDADGIGSSYLIKYLLERSGLPHQQILFNRAGAWKNFLAPYLSASEEYEGRTAFFFSDLGADLDALVPVFRDRPEEVYILDHHEIDKDFDLDRVPENLHLVNPTLFGLDGLKECAGATVNYFFTKEIQPTVVKHAWLGVLGIAGDALMRVDQLKSLNLELYEEAVMEEVVEEHHGIALFGASHDTVKNALRLSILPYIRELNGDLKLTRKFLRELHLSPNKRAQLLDAEEIAKIEEGLAEDVTGSIALFPGRAGILHFAFEFGLLLNVTGFHSKTEALRLVNQRNITQHAKNLYYDYVENLVKNLTTFLSLPTHQLGKAQLVRVTDEIPKSSWSDTASFASVNDLFDTHTMLFLAGREDSKIKFSVRCSEAFLAENGYGVDTVIRRLRKHVAGMGGGHKLAGGLKIDNKDFGKLQRVLPSCF